LDSELRFAVFNSSGYLLGGDRGFDRAEYSEIAKRCDRAECSLYCKVGDTGTLILGRRFLVRAIGGREERVSVVAESTGGDITRGFETFYDGARGAVENLEDRSYQVVGIWEEGDILDHTPLSRVSTFSQDPTSLSSKVGSDSRREPVSGALMSLCAGKIIANEEVTIRLSATTGLTLIQDVFLALRKDCNLKIPFSCALAKYQPETDLWVIPDEAGQQRKGKTDYEADGSEYFRALYRYIASGATIDTIDRNGFAREAKTRFLKSVGASRIIGYFPNRHDLLFRLYLHDSVALEKLLGDIPPDRLLNLSEEISLAVLRALVSGGRRSPSASGWLYPPDPVRKYAPRLIKGLSKSNRYQARKIFVDGGYFIESEVEGLVSDVLKHGNGKDIDLLSRMTFANEVERKFFADTASKKVAQMDFDGTVERIKDFLRWNGNQSKAMEMMLLELCNRAERTGDLYRALNRAERAEILTRTGKRVWKKPKSNRRHRIHLLLLILLVLFVVAIVVVFLVLPYMGINVAGDISQFFSSIMPGATENASDLASMPQSSEARGG